MENVDYRKVAQKILSQNGIYSYDTLDDEPLECDSLTFISIIVGIENELSIIVDNSLLINYPQTYNEYITLIIRAVELYQDSKDQNGTDDEDDEDDEEDDNEDDNEEDI